MVRKVKIQDFDTNDAYEDWLEFRRPKAGEQYLNCANNILTATVDYMAKKFVLIPKKVAIPKDYQALGIYFGKPVEFENYKTSEHSPVLIFKEPQIGEETTKFKGRLVGLYKQYWLVEHMDNMYFIDEIYPCQ